MILLALLPLFAPLSVAAAATQEAAPTKASQAEEALTAAVRWLVENQQADGSWGSHHSPRPIEVLASVPGSQNAFRVATTGLVTAALQESPLAGDDGLRAANRGIDFLLEAYDVKRQSGLEHYNVWSFGYALQCFGERLLAQPDDARAERIRAAAEHLIDKLDTYQTLDGGWGYLSLDMPTFKPSDTSMSFTTASILVGIERVRRAGVEVPEPLVARAVDHVKRSRLPDGAFLYGEYLKYRPRAGINQRKGSACRNPLCHYALELFGEKPPKEDTQLESLRDLLVRHAGFQRAAIRRPIPHESWYAISGYFYLYGHAYAAYVIEEQPAPRQAELWPLLVDAVLVCRQPDGSFWDYPLYSYHKPYGTGFAVIALNRALAHL
ncbi:MAG: prenyltransferase/squalene oxidase repeat-containing protein [Planctomycetota bacterium]